jgi:hypothetical protein
VLGQLSKESSIAAKALMESSASDRDSSIQNVIRLTEVIAGEVYFASGVHQPGRESLPAIITRPEQTRFYHEADGFGSSDSMRWELAEIPIKLSFR